MTPADLPDRLPQGGLPEDKALLKTILPPLLDDFQHWFGSTLTLLNTREIGFLSDLEKQDLKTRVQTAQQQVGASKALTSLTDSQTGIDLPVVMAWHKLVHECWGVAIRHRKESSRKESSPETDTP